MRSFHWNEDYTKVRNFLFYTYNLTKTFQNWIPSMFENIKMGPGGTEYEDEEDEYIKIWEDPSISNEEQKIVAVTICKPSGDCRILIHPNYRAHERDLVSWLENQRKGMKEEPNQELQLYFFVDEVDSIRLSLLKDMGYEDKGVDEHNRILPVDISIPEVKLPDNYSIRHVDVEKDFKEYRDVLTSVFPHCANMTPNLARIYSEAEFYKAELDIVVVAPDKTFAAFTTVRIDPVSKLAELEPVGVHPDHRKLGLGKAIIFEGLRRLQKYNPEAIVILGAASSEAATKLYDSIGFSRTDVHIWAKKV